MIRGDLIEINLDQEFALKVFQGLNLKYSKFKIFAGLSFKSESEIPNINP